MDCACDLLYLLYSYLNLESTKTDKTWVLDNCSLYSYLNLESTKTIASSSLKACLLYSYLNLESTKTVSLFFPKPG